MAKNSQPSEATRSSSKMGPTAKERRRDKRHAAAEARRSRSDYIIPMNAMVPLSSLPAKAISKMIEELGENYTSPDMLVPDPRRGMMTTGVTAKRLAVAKRFEQQRRIEKKRAQRRRFAALSPAAKREHRLAGIEHRIPADLIGKGR